MNETVPPFAKSGPSWAAVLKLLGLLAPFLVGAAMLWLGQEFATHSEVRAATEPLHALPAQVQSLIEFRQRQDKSQEKNEVKIEMIQTGMASLAAQQAGTDKKVDRVLDALERMKK